jgi:DNA-binding LytR/AlgR family response regulator
MNRDDSLPPARPPRALIADDERLMREQLRARLAEVWPALEIVAEAKNGAEAVALTESHHPDLVFLDIRMPGMTGIEAARAIAQLPVDEDDGDGWRGCEIVFITAYDQYAIEAFEQGVVDYVLKPAERERLLVTVERLRRRLARRHADDAEAGGDGTATRAAKDADSADKADTHAGAGASRGGPIPMQQLLQKLAARMDPARPPPLRWIQATVGQSIQMIPVEEVLFFISDEKYTRVQTATLEALIRKPIKELVDELDAELFWQIHRSTLVNTRCIAGVSRDFRGRQLVAVKGHPEKLEVSRSFVGLFKGM